MKISTANLNATTSTEASAASAPDAQPEAPVVAASVDSAVRSDSDSMFGDLLGYSDESSSSQKSGLLSSIKKKFDEIRSQEGVDAERVIKNLG